MAMTRRRRRRNPAMGGLLTPEVVKVGVGAAGAGVATEMIMGSSVVQQSGLPGLQSAMGQGLYRVVIPFGMGMALLKFGGARMKSVAVGAAVGGVIAGINSVMRYARNGRVAGTGEYFPRLYRRPQGSVRQPGSRSRLGARGTRSMSGRAPGYSAHNQFGRHVRSYGGVFTGERAFRRDAFAA